MHPRTLSLVVIGALALGVAAAPAPPDQGDHPSTLDQPGRQKTLRPQAPVVEVRHTSKRPLLA